VESHYSNSDFRAGRKRERAAARHDKTRPRSPTHGMAQRSKGCDLVKKRSVARKDGEQRKLVGWLVGFDKIICRMQEGANQATDTPHLLDR
jgi:hypothetical protein